MHASKETDPRVIAFLRYDFATTFDVDLRGDICEYREEANLGKFLVDPRNLFS
jgi:hypothetical protein